MDYGRRYRKIRQETVERTISRRGFVLGAPVALAGGLAVYSGLNARHELSVVTRSIPIQNLPAAFQGFGIAQISDIHYDEYIEPGLCVASCARSTG